MTPFPVVSPDHRDHATEYGDQGRFANARNAHSQHSRFLLERDKAEKIVGNMREQMGHCYNIVRSSGVSEKDTETIRRAFLYPGSSWSARRGSRMTMELRGFHLRVDERWEAPASLRLPSFVLGRFSQPSLKSEDGRSTTMSPLVFQGPSPLKLASAEFLGSTSREPQLRRAARRLSSIERTAPQSTGWIRRSDGRTRAG